jgi:hypothetical protein
MDKEKQAAKTEEKQTILNAKLTKQKFAGKSFVANVKYALRVVRKTRYIDTVVIKRHYIETRELYHQKMNTAFVSRTGNTSVEAFDNLFSAVDFSDTSTLWERKASLAKSINDNKHDVMGALIGTISSYIGSAGILVPLIVTINQEGMAAFSDYLIFGFFGILLFGFYEGYFSQSRLKRLVKEHEDYTSEFDQITGLLERKENLRVR